MATYKECLHFEVCRKYAAGLEQLLTCDGCEDFKDRSRFVELPCAEWVEDEDMYGEPVYHCSNFHERFVLEEGAPVDNCYFYCPNCGAKIAEQALKERERK